MLRAFETSIIDRVAAKTVSIFQDDAIQWIDGRLSPGTRWDKLRRFVPKQKLSIPPETEAIWLILMGPENYSLDLFRDWEKTSAKRILYVFDTFPKHIPRLKRLVSTGIWDVLVTSFNDAVPLLEAATGRRWFYVDQGIPTDLFTAPPAAERVIHFSAYGRREERAHSATLDFCRRNGLYYDFTTHNRSQPSASSQDLYRQYAWHVSHSVFTFSWPVDLTAPTRAEGLSPITCRWFEAAGAGTVVIGMHPQNPHFGELFGDNFVVPLDVNQSHDRIVDQLTEIWADREVYFARAQALRSRLNGSIDWAARVDEILSLDCTL
jgi:hypothetical protein